MGKIYVITSGKGGVGKTTTAVNLGAALNKFEEDVIVIDANISTPNLGLSFGAPIVPVSLTHVLQGKADVEEAVYEHESGLKIVPASLSLNGLDKIDVSKVKNAVKEMKRLAEHIILDSAAGLGDEAKVAIEAADEVIIVTNPNILSVTDSLKTIKLAQDLKKQIRGVILTRYSGDSTEMPIENIREMLEVPIIGIVPEDKSVQESLVKKNSVIHHKPRSKSARAYRDIAASILGKKKKVESILDKILYKFGI